MTEAAVPGFWDDLNVNFRKKLLMKPPAYIYFEESIETFSLELSRSNSVFFLLSCASFSVFDRYSKSFYEVCDCLTYSGSAKSSFSVIFAVVV